jgi:hypothetical protein
MQRRFDSNRTPARGRRRRVANANASRGASTPQGSGMINCEYLVAVLVSAFRRTRISGTTWGAAGAHRP